MNDLNIEFKLDRIHCHDEGDGPGNAEPYMWTVFFKVDGDTLVVNSDGPVAPFLQGAPTVVGTPGNHGNLGTSDVDEGDDVAVPAIIGEYRTIMKPIPLTTPLLGTSEVGGLIGCIVVLMEEDNTSNAAIALGHEALDRSVRDKLAEVLGTLSISKPEPSEEDIAALTDQIGSAVKDAIGNGVSVLSWIAGFGNMDDQIGSALFRFSHSQLEASGGAAIPFSRRWDNEGDWELFGHIKATPIRRPESKCCDELKQIIARLERVIANHEKRIAHLELMARLAELAKGSDTVKMVNKKASVQRG
ncbi:MAG: hypothetical protein ABI634_11295 [Acidobacteriota bacterium]